MRHVFALLALELMVGLLTVAGLALAIVLTKTSVLAALATLALLAALDIALITLLRTLSAYWQPRRGVRVHKPVRRAPHRNLTRSLDGLSGGMAKVLRLKDIPEEEPESPAEATQDSPEEVAPEAAEEVFREMLSGESELPKARENESEFVEDSARPPANMREALDLE